MEFRLEMATWRRRMCDSFEASLFRNSVIRASFAAS
jgi:hypothetical protein